MRHERKSCDCDILFATSWPSTSTIVSRHCLFHRHCRHRIIIRHSIIDSAHYGRADFPLPRKTVARASLACIWPRPWLESIYQAQRQQHSTRHAQRSHRPHRVFCLGHVDRKLAGSDQYLTVQGFCDLAQLGEVTCTDIGRWQLSGMFSRFEFVNRRLQRMWPGVREAPSDYEAYRKLASVRLNTSSGQAPNLNDQARTICAARIVRSTQTSLRFWVCLHDLLLDMSLSGELENLRISQDPSQDEKFFRLKQFAKSIRTHAGFDAKHLVDGIADRNGLNRWYLRGLKASDGHEVLSWASEYLSVNIATHDLPMPSTFRPGTITHRLSRWHEADGSLPTIEYHYREEKSAWVGVSGPLCMHQPIHSRTIIGREAASCSIGHLPISLKGIITVDWRRNFPDLSALEMKQVTFLCMAFYSDDIGPTSELHEVYQRWSADLLRR